MITLNEKLIGYDSKDRSKFNNEATFAGFTMDFENGYSISVQFGFGNYCNNEFLSKTSCKDAEIAVFKGDEMLSYFGNDQVKGYCSTDEVAFYINEVKNLTNENSK